MRILHVIKMDIALDCISNSIRNGSFIHLDKHATALSAEHSWIYVS